DLIGTDATLASAVFDTDHPLYTQIAALNELTTQYPALRSGAQTARLAEADAGIFAVSRFDRDERREFVITINGADTERTATIPTWGGTFALVFGDGEQSVSSSSDGTIEVTVPALSTLVYGADAVLPGTGAPRVSLQEPTVAADDAGRVEVVADVTAENYAEVSFWAKTSEGEWTHIGTDDNAPFRVFDDVSALTPGEAIEYLAVASDGKGNDRTSQAVATTVPAPTVTLVSPAPG